VLLVGEPNRLNQALFEVLACYVGNKIHQEGSTERKFDLYQTMAASFNNLIPSFRLKDHMDEELFRYLPERNWPPTFLDFIITLQGKAISDTFYPTKNQDIRAIAFFGFKIWSAFVDVKQTITNKYHLHWDEVERNRSGNSTSAFLESIRDKAWRSGLEAKAKTSQRNKENYARDKKKTTLYNAAFTPKMHQQQILEGLIQEGNNTYDSEWLSFLLLGKPSSYQLECFNLSHKPKFDLAVAIDEAKDKFKKGARREAAKGKSQDPPNSTASPLKIVLEKDEDEVIIRDCEAMISHLQEEDDNEEEIEEYRSMIKSVRKAKIYNLAKKRGYVDENNVTGISSKESQA
jgi:hypothetical protein